MKKEEFDNLVKLRKAFHDGDLVVAEKLMKLGVNPLAIIPNTSGGVTDFFAEVIHSNNGELLKLVVKYAGDEYSVKEDSNKTSFTRYNKDSEPLLKVSKTRYKTQDGKEVHGLSIVIYKPEDNPAALDDVKRILLSKENQIVSVAACGSLESAKALIDKFGGNKLDFSKDAFAGLEENTRAKVEKEVNAYLLEHPEPAAVRPSKKNRA